MRPSSMVAHRVAAGGVVLALLLLAAGVDVGTARHAGAAPAAPATATGGFLRLWAPQFMAGNAPVDEAAAVSAAQSSDVLAVNTGDYAPYVDAMHAARPGVRILFYEVAVTANYNETGFPEACYLHDASGNRLLTVATGTNRWAMDPRCPEWIADRIATAQNVMAAKGRFDGILMDVLGLAPTQSGFLSGLAIDPKTHKPFTASDWLSATVSLAQAVKRATGGEMVGNGLNSGRYLYVGSAADSTWRIADGLDGGESECWFWCRNTGPPPLEDWTADLRMLADPAHPHPIFVTAKGWTAPDQATRDAEHLFSMASFLLGTDGNDYYSWTDTQASDATVMGQMERRTAGLGAPLGAMTTGSPGVYQRRFVGGLVLANVSGSNTVILPGPMTTIDGQTVTSLQMTAGQGAVLFSPPSTNSAMTTGGFSNGAWTLVNANSAKGASSTFTFGAAGDSPVVGDWDGNHSTTIGVVRGNAWYLRNANSSGPSEPPFSFGRAGDQFLIGDWDGNLTSTPGVRRDKVFYLNNSFHSGTADIAVPYGLATDEAFVGDWDGNGSFTPGVRRGKTFYLKNSFTGGVADIVVPFGLATDELHMGDWNGDGVWTPGLLRSGAAWYLQNSFQGGDADITFPDQAPGSALVGDWDGSR